MIAMEHLCEQLRHYRRGGHVANFWQFAMLGRYAEAAPSPAQRARRYRSRRRDSSIDGVEKLSDASLIDQLKRWLRYVADDRADQPVLDMYIEEFVKRHHSSRADLYDLRKK